MNAMQTMIPRSPRIPSDYVLLLTYTPSSNRIQANRVAASTAVELGISLDGSTQADELAA